MSKKPPTCILCDCTDDHGCDQNAFGIEDGFGVRCHWINKSPPLCSACASVAAIVVEVVIDKRFSISSLRGIDEMIHEHRANAELLRRREREQLKSIKPTFPPG